MSDTIEFEFSPKREEYMQVVLMHNANRIDYNERKWATIKLTQTAFGGLTAAAILGIFNKIDDLKNHHALFITLSVLPDLAGIIIYAGANNLKRETRYLFEEE